MLSYSSPHSGHFQLTAIALADVTQDAAHVEQVVVALVDGVAYEVDGGEVALPAVPLRGPVPRGRVVVRLDNGGQLLGALLEASRHLGRVLVVVVVVGRRLVGVRRRQRGPVLLERAPGQ